MKPVNRLKGGGSFNTFLLKPRVASVKTIAIKITIAMPVTPSMPVKRLLKVGFTLSKSEAISANFSGDELIRRGKSHAKWFPA